MQSPRFSASTTARAASTPTSSTSAKTYAELDELVADFPGAESDRTGAVRGRPRLPFALLPLALIAAIVLSHGHILWLAFPLFFLFVVRPRLWRSVGPGTWCGYPRARRSS